MKDHREDIKLFFELMILGTYCHGLIEVLNEFFVFVYRKPETDRQSYHYITEFQTFSEAESVKLMKFVCTEECLEKMQVIEEDLHILKGRPRHTTCFIEIIVNKMLKQKLLKDFDINFNQLYQEFEAKFTEGSRLLTGSWMKTALDVVADFCKIEQ